MPAFLSISSATGSSGSPMYKQRGAFHLGHSSKYCAGRVALVLPLPVIWKLQTTAKLKVALTATFMVGSMYAYPF